MISHQMMVAIFGAAAVLIVASLAAVAFRILEGIDRHNPQALAAALRDALSLKYLGNGGFGCAFGRRAPFASPPLVSPLHVLRICAVLLSHCCSGVLSLRFRLASALRAISVCPVMLGTLGGIGLLIGPAGLYWLFRRRDPAVKYAGQNALDTAFLALLFFTSLTGLLLLALRESPADEPASRHPSRHGAGSLPDHALREIRARLVSPGGAGPLCARDHRASVERRAPLSGEQQRSPSAPSRPPATAKLRAWLDCL